MKIVGIAYHLAVQLVYTAYINTWLQGLGHGILESNLSDGAPALHEFARTVFVFLTCLLVAEVM